jgi:hypothetical protein
MMINSPYLYWAASTARRVPYPNIRSYPTGFVPYRRKEGSQRGLRPVTTPD